MKFAPVWSAVSFNEQIPESQHGYRYLQIDRYLNYDSEIRRLLVTTPGFFIREFRAGNHVLLRDVDGDAYMYGGLPIGPLVVECASRLLLVVGSRHAAVEEFRATMVIRELQPQAEPPLEWQQPPVWNLTVPPPIRLNYEPEEELSETPFDWKLEE